jgi:methylmalonyl-CoA mutase
MADRDPADTKAGIALAGEFPAVDLAAWKALAGDLDRLRSTTLDGLTIEPLYTADDTLGDRELPGFAPFVRGRTASGTRAGGWEVRQMVDHLGERVAVGELERGASGLFVNLRRADTVDADLLGRILEGVYLDLVPVVLDAGDRWRDGAEAIVALWERLGLDPAVVTGNLGADPLGCWVSNRSLDVDADLADAAAWAARMRSDHPGMRTYVVNGTRFANAGASDALELGFSAAYAVATLRSLVDDGRLHAADAFAQLEFRYAATADQFATIAKFRAARRVWARVAEIAGVQDAAAFTTIHALSASAMMTRYDPAVNMLRGTVACFAAGVAGADAITVLPYDHFSSADGSEPSMTELGRRIARNTQSVLAMESHLADVIDPAGGSWYVERLTADLAQAAWNVFQEVEQIGGFRAAVEAGVVTERIAAVRAKREADINRRKAPITGVTEFPNIAEPAPAVVRASTSPDGDDPTTRDLGGPRWVEHIENLRSRVDAAAAAGGSRPAVFLATIGTPAAFTARAMFAKNFFEVAGIETRSGPVTSDPVEIAAAFAADVASVACICSTDDTYADRGVAVAGALAAAGAGRVYLAGTPKDLIGTLTAAGVTHTISAGADVFAALSDLVEFLGVA